MRRDLLSRSMRRCKYNIKLDVKDVMLFNMLVFHETWILVNPACHVLRLWIEERLPDMENRCEYID